MKAEIGLLIIQVIISIQLFIHSPLKYFEYLYADLKIIGVDFPSHRAFLIQKIYLF